MLTRLSISIICNGIPSRSFNLLQLLLEFLLGARAMQRLIAFVLIEFSEFEFMFVAVFVELFALHINYINNTK